MVWFVMRAPHFSCLEILRVIEFGSDLLRCLSGLLKLGVGGEMQNYKLLVFSMIIGLVGCSSTAEKERSDLGSGKAEYSVASVGENLYEI